MTPRKKTVEELYEEPIQEPIQETTSEGLDEVTQSAPERVSPEVYLSSGITLLNLATTNHPDCFVERGTYVLFVGQSGAGKSSLEKSAAGGLLYRKAAAAGTGIAVGAVTALMMQGPVIRSLRYYDQTIPVNTQRIECSVKSRWAVKEARIEGKDWPVTEENGIYTAEIPENGSFVFTVTDQLGQSVRQGFRIGNIDRVAPVYRDYTENGDMVVLRFGEGESEVMSGIDWDNTCFRDAEGNTVTPQAVNRQTDEALLPKDSFPLEAKVEDFAGNYGTYRLTLKTVTLNAEGGSHAE